MKLVSLGGQDDSYREALSFYDLAIVRQWIAKGRLPNREGQCIHDREWQTFLDDDGAICLLPEHTPEIPLAIMVESGEFCILVCDPDDMDELGPFDSLEAALRGLASWLSLEQREVSGYSGWAH